jgi:hypothetical protein
MTLSSKQIGDIANLYESIIASEQEDQLDEDIKSFADKGGLLVSDDVKLIASVQFIEVVMA